MKKRMKDSEEVIDFEFDFHEFEEMLSLKAIPADWEAWRRVAAWCNADHIQCKNLKEAWDAAGARVNSLESQLTDAGSEIETLRKSLKSESRMYSDLLGVIEDLRRTATSLRGQNTRLKNAAAKKASMPETKPRPTLQPVVEKQRCLIRRCESILL